MILLSVSHVGLKNAENHVLQLRIMPATATAQMNIHTCIDLYTTSYACFNSHHSPEVRV